MCNELLQVYWVLMRRRERELKGSWKCHIYLKQLKVIIAFRLHTQNFSSKWCWTLPCVWLCVPCRSVPSDKGFKPVAGEKKTPNEAVGFKHVIRTCDTHNEQKLSKFIFDAYYDIVIVKYKCILIMLTSYQWIS